MRISLDEARRIARLAHLRFSEEELDRLRGQLDLILDYVGRLAGASRTGGSEGREGPSCRPGDLRDDVPAETLGVEAALGDAPDCGEGHFKVPRVIP